MSDSDVGFPPEAGPVPGNDGGQHSTALALFESELSLVNVVAKQVFRNINELVELEELLSAGREGLFEAARRFDASQGVPFRAYANYRVRGAILDAVRKASWLPRRNQERMLALQAAGLVSEGAVAHVFANIDDLNAREFTSDSLEEHLAAVVTAGSILAETGGPAAPDADTSIDSNPEEACANSELLDLIRAEISNLNPTEAQVIRHMYLENHSLEETAKALNHQKPWVCRLQKRALDRLTKRLRPLVIGDN